MREILEFTLLQIGDFSLSVVQVLSAILILVVARILAWLITSVLKRYFKRRNLDPGSQYAILTLIRYFLFLVAFLLALQAVGVTLSLIWAGAAALLVGLGFGLQHIFNDFVSGIILLVDRSVEVNDVVIVEGLVGVVRKIGLRTSKVETRDRNVIIIPNSKLVSEKVTNWSHNNMATRFSVKVGVDYASDVRLVERIMLEAAKEHPQVNQHPAPRIAFEDFGDSALIFTLYFFSEELWLIEFVRSDLRFSIIERFRKSGIHIPFPQRDMWLRNAPVLTDPNDGSSPTPS